MRVSVSWVPAGLALLLAASPAHGQLTSQRVVSGLTFPVAVVQDPTQPDVQYVVEQGGRIRVVRNGQLLAFDFLDIRPLVLSGGERGLLGLAFAPDYATSRRFFVNYTRQPDGHTVISRYRRMAADPLRADPTSRFDLLWPGGNRFIVQPAQNHNGGDLQFGSDGYLYIPLGDGGGSNDFDHRAQDPQQLLGKVLRIDVDVADADFEGYDVPPDNPFVGRAGYLPEIWAFGLRNPFRFTVDAIARGGTGALVIADVGQSSWEEIDYEPFGAGGRNYGWRNREGAHANVTSLPPAFTPLTDPIFEYSHAVGNVITGGVVYRGTGLGVDFWGRYFFADFGARRLWSLGLVPGGAGVRAGSLIEHTAELGGTPAVGNVSAFGIGANCEIFYLSWSAGELRRIVRPGGPPAGCPTSPDPFRLSGGGVFVNGQWVPRSDPSAAGAGLGGAPPPAAGGCATPQPVASWVCVGGNWVPPDHPLAAGSGSDGGTGDTAGGGTGGTGDGGVVTCTTSAPAAGWVCVSGSWVPPDHPLAGSAGGGGGTGGTGGGTNGGTGGTGGGGVVTCTTPAPGAGWVCVGGSWVPPDHPLAVSGGGTGDTGGGTGGGTGGTDGGGAVTCTTPAPGAGWVCASGSWVPPDHPLARSAP
ncbi:MAG TPA: PQQ-dependent sugar dehydrogenase [Vicinamibacterales bacterium]